MEVTVSHRGGVEFAAAARGHVIHTSASRNVGGADDAMMPTELVLAAVGTCVSYYAAQYLKKQQLPMAPLNVRVTAEIAKNPARLDAFHVYLELPPLSAEHTAGVEDAVHHCTVHNTLFAGADVWFHLPAAQ
jgi:putative redox protein